MLQFKNGKLTEDSKMELFEKVAESRGKVGKELRHEAQYFEAYHFDIPGCSHEDRANPWKTWTDCEGIVHKDWIGYGTIASDGFCDRCKQFHYRFWFGQIKYTGEGLGSDQSGYQWSFLCDELEAGMATTRLVPVDPHPEEMYNIAGEVIE